MAWEGHLYQGRPNSEAQGRPEDRLTLPIAETLSGKNVRAWVSMVLYLKK